MFIAPVSNKTKTLQQIFTNIYTKNTWNSKESSSGTGSTLESTYKIRRVIPKLINEYKIGIFIDCPCGDLNWLSHIFDDINIYIGIDIVQEIIKKNKKKYEDKLFFTGNILNDDDDITQEIIQDPKQFLQNHTRYNKKFIQDTNSILFCRDLLVHFSYEDIIKFFNKIRNSKIDYILTTTFLNRKFRNISTGGWRPISLFEEPFAFPKPLHIINEECHEHYPIFIDKSLVLWKIKHIPSTSRMK